MAAFDSDRPEGYDEKKHKYPYIHPEDLRPAERLAVDADSVEDFIEHFANHKDHVHKGGAKSDEPESQPESADS